MTDKISGNTVDTIWLDETNGIDWSKLSIIDYASASPPTNLTTGQVYYNYNTNSTNLYDGTQWVTIPATTASTTVNTISTLDIGNITLSDSFKFHLPKEFEDHMPAMSKVKEMCELYPGFKKAYEHFKDIYDLVHDDYQERSKDV